MKFKIKNINREIQSNPKIGDIRVQKGFAFFPVRINKEEKVWLEFYKFLEIYDYMNDPRINRRQYDWCLYDKKHNESYMQFRKDEWASCNSPEFPEYIRNKKIR